MPDQRVKWKKWAKKIEQISLVGVETVDDYEVRRALRLNNILSMLGIIGIILVIPVFIVAGGSGIIRQLIAGGLLFSTALITANFNLPTTSRICTIFSLNGLILSLSWAFGPESNIHSSFLVSLIMPLAVFSTNEPKELVITTLFAPLGYLAASLTQFSLIGHESFGPDFSKGFELLFTVASLMLAVGILYRLYTIVRLYRKLAEYRLFQRDQIVNLISHDINGSLAIIQGSLKLIERNYQVRNQPSGKRYYERAMRAFSSITDIVENVRYIRLENDNPNQLQRELVEFSECIEYLKFTFEDKMDAKGIHFVTHDYTDGQASFFVDSVAFLHSVLSNIVSNAIKFSHPGGTITISIKKENEALIVIVEDQGIGMSIEEQSALFSPSYRSSKEGTTGERRGSGVGMHIVAKYVRAFKGTINVESEEGKGTTVTITLPSSEVQDPEVDPTLDLKGA